MRVCGGVCVGVHDELAVSGYEHVSLALPVPVVAGDMRHVGVDVRLTIAVVAMNGVAVVAAVGLDVGLRVELRLVDSDKTAVSVGLGRSC